MSAEVITVTGPIGPGALGITSMHEHALADGRSYLLAPDERPAAYAAGAEGELSLGNLGAIRRQFDLNEHNLLVDDPDLVTAELADFSAAGGRTVVDMSCPGMRVDAGALARISSRSGVQIVTGTGLYVKGSRPDRFAAMGIDELSDWMIEEIEVGIEGSGVRAGQIGEIGITTLDGADRRLLRAAVRAADRTGVSVSIHPGFEPGTDGRAIADVLESEGARPERIVIGHGDAFVAESSLRLLIDDPASWRLRLDYHRELLGRGYNVSFDCFGHDWGRGREGWTIETDWQRFAALIALLREGHATQLVVGCDVFMRCLHRRGGGLGYAHLLHGVLPTLRDHGIDDVTIEQLTVANPGRVLARETH